MADPIAKTIVDIDANIAPLQQKLGEAKAQIASASAQMATAASSGARGGATASVAGAGGAASAGAASPFANSSSEILRNAKSYQEVMANAEAFIQRNQQAAKALSGGMKGAADQSKFLNIGVAATAGAIAAVGRAADQLWKGIKGFADGSRAMAADLRAIESQFRSDITASLDPITARREEIEKTKKAALEQLETEKTSRGIIGDIVGLVTDEAEQRIKIQKIETEAAAAQVRLQKKAQDDAKKAEEEAKKKKADEEKKGIEEASKVARDLQIQAMDERGQLEARFNDEAMELEKKRDAAKTDAERNLYEDSIQFRESVFLKDLKDLEERKNKEKQNNKDLEKDREKQQREFMKAQAEAFANVKQQINSLFNTGSMETSINRVADLVQVLIDKTER